MLRNRAHHIYFPKSLLMSSDPLSRQIGKNFVLGLYWDRVLSLRAYRVKVTGQTAQPLRVWNFGVSLPPLNASCVCVCVSVCVCACVERRCSDTSSLWFFQVSGCRALAPGSTYPATRLVYEPTHSDIQVSLNNIRTLCRMLLMSTFSLYWKMIS